jgi:hypothetical protein
LAWAATLFATALLLASVARAQPVQPTSVPTSRPYVGLCPDEAPCPEAAVGTVQCFCYEDGKLADVEVDRDGDRVPDVRITHYYGEDGLMTFEVEEEDTDFDGRPDLRTVSIYDDQGREMRREIDGGPDGQLDRMLHFEYDARGLLVRAVADVNMDTYIDASWTYEYDEEGRRVASQADYNNDGEVDEHCVAVPPCPPPYEECTVSCVEEPVEEAP